MGLCEIYWDRLQIDPVDSDARIMAVEASCHWLTVRREGVCRVTRFEQMSCAFWTQMAPDLFSSVDEALRPVLGDAEKIVEALEKADCAIAMASEKDVHSSVRPFGSWGNGPSRGVHGPQG